MFDENHRYTPDALNLDREASAALQPLFERYLKLGYSPRDIFTIISHAVFDLELDVVMSTKPEVEGTLVGQLEIGHDGSTH